MVLQPARHNPHFPESFAAQVQDLINRGMTVEDPDYAVRCLTHIGYHRLANYWWPFQVRPQSATFRKEATFDLVMARYMFDQRLRSLLLEALSYIEISVRNQWSRHLVSHSGRGEFAHLDSRLFDERFYADNLREMEQNYKRIRGRNGPALETVPIWQIASTMSFGSLSKWYSSLTDRTTRLAISVNYGLDEGTFRSVLRHLASVRNTCAHHERVWNQTVKPGMRIPRTAALYGYSDIGFNRQAQGKVYNALVMIVHILEIIAPNGNWPRRLIRLKSARRYASIPETQMGFPPNWKDLPIWRHHSPSESLADE